MAGKRTKWTEEMISEAFEAHFDHNGFKDLVEAMNKRWGTTFSHIALRSVLATAYPDHAFIQTLGQRKRAQILKARADQAQRATAALKAEVCEALGVKEAPPPDNRPDYGKFTAEELRLNHMVPADPAMRGDLRIEIPEDKPTVLHLWPDAHVPHHEPAVVEACMLFTEYMKPDIVVDLGDFLDLDVISNHSPSDLREHDVLFEATHGVEILRAQALRLDKAGVKTRVFIAGNHEDRLHRFLCEKAPELYRVVPNIPALLELPQNGWKFVAYGGRLRVGNVKIAHGERFNEHVAAGYTRKEGNFAFGHTHRMQIFVTNTRDGYPEMAMTCGTRGKLEHIYQRHAKTDHVHGMGIVTVHPTGAVSMSSVLVLDNKIHYPLPDGKMLVCDGLKGEAKVI